MQLDAKLPSPRAISKEKADLPNCLVFKKQAQPQTSNRFLIFNKPLLTGEIVDSLSLAG